MFASLNLKKRNKIFDLNINLKSRGVKRLLFIGALVPAFYAVSYANEDFYYFMLGLKRGVISIFTGAQIITNYYIHGANEDSHEYAAKKLYKLFKSNSGTYIKLGQSLSQSEHVLPKPFITNLEPLCQEAPMTDITRVRKMVETEFGKKFEEVFEEFQEVPLGSASLAQVHKAKLKGSKAEVAIKVQHPMIAIYCPSDIAIVKFATRVGEILWPGVKLQWIAKEFERNITKEIDFTNESKNAEKIKKFFEDEPRVVIPTIYWKFCTKKIITMSFEKGKSIVDTQNRLDNQIHARDVAELLAIVFNRQIFEFGFVHSDPHHGNLFIRRENVNGKSLVRLVLLDHGLYRELDPHFRKYYSLLWRGIFIQSEPVIREACEGLNVTNPEIFISILTNRTYRDVMKEELKYSTKDRLGEKMRSDVERKQVRDFMHANLKSITNTLSDMRSEMFLVLKINGFLRSIDRRIGNPINNFNIMIEHVYKGLISDLEQNKKEASQKLQLYFEFWKFKFIIFCINIYYALFINWRTKEEEVDRVDLNVEN